MNKSTAKEAHLLQSNYSTIMKVEIQTMFHAALSVDFNHLTNICLTKTHVRRHAF